MSQPDINLRAKIASLKAQIDAKNKLIAEINQNYHEVDKSLETIQGMMNDSFQVILDLSGMLSTLSAELSRNVGQDEISALQLRIKEKLANVQSFMNMHATKINSA